MSSALSALAIAFLYKNLMFLAEKWGNSNSPYIKWFCAALSLNVLAGFEFIEQSLLIEVYSLHLALLMLLFYSLSRKVYLWTGLITGLALANHSTAIYFFAFTLLWLVFIDKIPLKNLIKPGLTRFLPGALLGLTPYLYLLFVYDPLNPLQWGDPSHWTGFKEIVFRTNYWRLPENSFSKIWSNHVIAMGHFLNQWVIVIPILFASSLFLYISKKYSWKKEVLVWHICWVIQLPIMSYLADMGINDEGMKLSSVFYIPSYFFTAFGILYLWPILKKLNPIAPKIAPLLLLLTFFGNW